jgi:acetyl-CoA carboxylase biotin carboxyl carrier protein
MTSLPFDADAVRSLAMILADTGLTEIEIEGKEGRIRVVRAQAPVAAAPAALVSLNQAAPPPAPAPAASAAPAAAPDDAAHPGAVLSPMVGVAYLASEPGSAPYVSLGQTVAAGQTVMLIEAMKTFNQIKAPKAGTVTRVLIAAGAPVEFGQPLMIIE